MPKYIMISFVLQDFHDRVYRKICRQRMRENFRYTFVKEFMIFKYLSNDAISLKNDAWNI